MQSEKEKMKYFICGFSGAGKSSIGRELKKVTSLEVIDLDDYILEKNLEFQYLGEYIEAVGMEQFRKDELKAINDILKMDDFILILGGGTLNASTVGVLDTVSGFWLNTDFETCHSRIKGDKNRPLSKLSKESLQELYQERVEYYQKYLKISSFEDLVEELQIQ